MAFAFRTAFAVGVATVGAGATLMSTMNPPCYRQPESDSLASHDHLNQRPRVTLQTVWDPSTSSRAPSHAPSPSATTCAPSPARRRILESSISEDERSAYTAHTDFSASDPGSITPSSRPVSVFASLAVDQLLKQRQELELAVSQLQEESQRLRISNSDMEQAAAGLVGYLKQLQSRREEAIAEYNDIEAQLEELRRDLRSLRTELAGSCAARDAARVDLGDTRTARDAVRDELLEARELISEAKKALANVVSERDSAKSQLDTISRSRADVSLELATRKAELHQTTESSQHECRRLDGLRKESATLASSLEQARLEHVSTMRRIQGVEQDARARLSPLRETEQKEAKSRTLAATEQERRERQALDALHRETSEAQRLQKTELTRMQAEIKDAQAAIAKVQTELRTAKTSLTEQKRLYVKGVADLDAITAQKGKVEQEARTATEEAARARDAALRAQQELGRLNAAIQEGTVRLARVTTSGSRERVQTTATPIALSVPQGADSFSQDQQRSYHAGQGRADADRSEMDHEETNGQEDSSPATKGFWSAVPSLSLWKSRAAASQPQAAPPPMPVPETQPVLRDTGSRLLVDARAGQGRGGMATPPTSPDTQKMVFPARQPSSADLPTTQINVLKTTAVQGSTPPMTAIDPPPALPAAAYPAQAPMTSESLRRPLPVGPITNVANSPFEPRASKQHSSEKDAAATAALTIKPPGNTHATPASTLNKADVHAKVPTQTQDGSKPEATSDLSKSPNTRRSASPARRSAPAAPAASRPEASAPTTVQEPSLATAPLEAPANLASAPISLASRGTSVQESVPTPKTEQVRPNVADPTSESHASQQRPLQGQALLPMSKAKPLLSSSDEQALSTASATSGNRGSAAIVGDAIATTSDPEEPKAGTGSSSPSPKAGTSKRRDKTSTSTDDKTEEGSMEATTKPATTGTTTKMTTTRSAESTGEALLPLVEVKAPEEEPSTAEAVPAPALPQDATAASVIPPVVSGEPQIAEPQTDAQPKNDISDQTSQVPVDAAVETPTPPYQAYPDDEIISFTPGAKVWPVVMLEVILPSGYSKAPSDLDQRATAPKGGKARP